MSKVDVEAFAVLISSFSDKLDQRTIRNARDLYLQLGESQQFPDSIGQGTWPTIRFCWDENVEIEIFESSFEFYEFYDGRSEITEYLHIPGSHIPSELLNKMLTFLKVKA